MRTNLAVFIEQYYNRRRLHSALGYQSPEAFEHAVAAAGHPVNGATLRWPWKEKSQ